MNNTLKYTNRLIKESSPYLLQHAHNPVNWYAWDDDAFTAALRENKPIFLSIGYSTCHWCHVMETESFDDESIAALLNKYFICIKVDREQHPDLDNIYMTAVQLISGQGGWPMSSFLTPEGKPFYGGTYFPPQRFAQLLTRIAELWSQQEPQLRAEAERITEEVRHYTSLAPEAARLDQPFIEVALQRIHAGLDRQYGGFRNSAPKFPQESLLLFLTDQLLRSDRPDLLQALEFTLHKMAEGGIYDQIGGGFHRYSTDPCWLVPHFEKMLYNQALLARAYAATYLLTGDPFYKRIAEETLDYVLRDMRSPQGCFYSATDADSEGAEGTFFLWTIAGIRAVLSPEDAALAIDLYGMTEAGNFEQANILFLATSVEHYARQQQLPLQELLNRLDRIKRTLYQAREARTHPFRDEKIITAWNAMTITTLAKCASLLTKPDYLAAAVGAANYLWQTHVDAVDNQLWRTSLNGKAAIHATQEDYAYFAEALITLFDSTGDTLWLQRSQTVTDKMIAEFHDQQRGGFFSSTAKRQDPLIVAIKDQRDGAIPSGNSVALQVLVQLSQRTGVMRYHTLPRATLAAVSGLIRQQPDEYAYALMAIANQMSGDTTPRQYLAHGHITAELSLAPVQTFPGHQQQAEPTLALAVTLTMDDGWHVNAHQPAYKELIPTIIELADSHTGCLLDICYPPGVTSSLNFQQEPLLLYQGTTQIHATVRLKKWEPLLRVKLQIQPCSNQYCLSSETRIFCLPLP